MMAAAPAVETKDLVKVFERGRRTIWQRLRRERDKRDRFRAVDGIDLVVEPGEIFGLLGPNGAGKTTTMKMLATLLIPTSGTIRVLGVDPLERPRDVRARLGAMLSGERSLYWKLTGRENLEYFAALYHVPPSETKARIAHGRIVALDTPAALKRTIRAEEVVRLEIALQGDERPVIDRLARSATVARSERSNGTLAVTAHCASARDFVPAAFDAARSTGATIRHVEVVPVTLEDVFLALTGRALRE